jgi:hypothetical protein
MKRDSIITLMDIGTLVSSAKHSTDCSAHIIIWGWYSRPVVASIIVDFVPLYTTEGKKKDEH